MSELTHNHDPQSGPQLAVLMYHGLHESVDEQGSDPVYSVSPDRFEAHLDLLERLGYRLFADSQLAGGGIREPAAMITFDDGLRSDYERALPLLETRNAAATFFVTSDWIDSPGHLSATMLRELANAGMSIGSHGRSHRYLSTLPDKALDDELLSSRDRLQDLIGRPVVSVSLPGGRGGKRAMHAAWRAGYQRIYGSQLGFYRLGAERCIPRLPIRANTSEQVLESMLRRSPAFWSRRARQWLLDSAKTVMGDPLYDRLRNRLLRS